MAVSESYRTYVMEQLKHIADVSDRKMFGGVGIFVADAMFGLVSSDDVLYFKADDSNRADYEAAEMPRFGKMPYYQVPGDVLDDSSALQTWAEKAMAVARAAKK